MAISDLRCGKGRPAEQCRPQCRPAYFFAISSSSTEQDRTYLAEADRESALLLLQAASCTYGMALGPRAGQKMLSLQSLASPDKSSTPDLCAKLHGFSLHAAVRWGADQRKEHRRARRDRLHGLGQCRRKPRLTAPISKYKTGLL